MTFKTVLVPGVGWPARPDRFASKTKPRGLTPSQVEEIRALRKAGATYVELEVRYGLHRRTLSHAVKGIGTYSLTFGA